MQRRERWARWRCGVGEEMLQASFWWRLGTKERVGWAACIVKMVELLVRILGGRPTFCARTTRNVLALRTSRRACQTARSHRQIGTTPQRRRYNGRRRGNCSWTTYHERLPVPTGRRAPFNQRIHTPPTTYSTTTLVHTLPPNPSTIHLTHPPDYLHPLPPAKYRSSPPGVLSCPAQTSSRPRAAPLWSPQVQRHWTSPLKSRHILVWAACRSGAVRVIRIIRVIWCARGDMGF